MKLFFTLAVIAVLLGTACTDAPKVVKGTVLSYDATAKSLVLKDECPPNRELTVSLSGTEIGAEVQANDIVLVAYHGEGGTVAAVRVMNISRQKERGLADAKVASKRCKTATP